MFPRVWLRVEPTILAAVRCTHPTRRVPFLLFKFAVLPGTGAERLRELAEEVPGSKAPVPATRGVLSRPLRAASLAGSITAWQRVDRAGEG